MCRVREPHLQLVNQDGDRIELVIFTLTLHRDISRRDPGTVVCQVRRSAAKSSLWSQTERGVMSTWQSVRGREETLDSVDIFGYGRYRRNQRELMPDVPR